MSGRATIGSGFSCDCMTKWRPFFKPIAQRGNHSQGKREFLSTLGRNHSKHAQAKMENKAAGCGPFGVLFVVAGFEFSRASNNQSDALHKFKSTSSVRNFLGRAFLIGCNDAGRGET